MSGTLVSTLLRWALSLLSFLAAFLVVFLVYLRGSEKVYNNGVRFSVPYGYGLDMAYVPPSQSPCYVVRLTEDSCPYCRQDSSEYRRVIDAARNAGCLVVELGPRSGDIARRDEAGPLQLQYVDMSFGEALVPSATPQTIILDKDAVLRWHHQGSMAPTNAAAATNEIEFIVQHYRPGHR